MPIMIVCFLLSSKDIAGGLLGFSISTSTGLIIMLSLQSLMMGSGGVTYKQRPDLFTTDKEDGGHKIHSR